MRNCLHGIRREKNMDAVNVGLLSRLGWRWVRRNPRLLSQVLSGWAALVMVSTTPAADAGEARHDSNEEIKQLKARLEKAEERNRAISDHLIYAPEVSNEDYADVRARFQTKLLRREASP